MATRLRGQELLDYVRENSGTPEKELATGAGYYTTTAEGNLQVNTKPFYQELAIAQGIMTPDSIGRGPEGNRRGKGLSYLLKTNPKSGNAVLTGGYLTQIGVKPGERIGVEVIAESQEVVLKRASDESQPSAAEEEVAEPALV